MAIAIPLKIIPRIQPVITSASDPLWYKDAVIYELHVRAFADSNNDGIGDFPGLLSRLDYLDNYLKGREFLLDHFSVADAYLVTVINWTMATPPIELAKWPTVKDYHQRLRARPSIARAIAEEFRLYQAELARHKAVA